MTWIATPQLRWVRCIIGLGQVLEQKYINPNNGETKWVAVPLETQP